MRSIPLIVTYTLASDLTKLTLCRRIFREKPTVARMVNYSPEFYGNRHHSHKSLSLAPVSEPDESSRQLPILLLKDPFCYNPPMYTQFFQVISFL